MITLMNPNRNKIGEPILINQILKGHIMKKKSKKKVTRVNLDWWFALRRELDQVVSKIKQSMLRQW